MALMKPSVSSCPLKNCWMALCMSELAFCGYAWSQDSWKFGASETRSYWKRVYSGVAESSMNLSVLVVVAGCRCRGGP